MASKHRSKLSSTSLCIKYLLFAANFIYFAAGCALVGVSLWICLERNFISAMVGEELMTVSAILLIVCGAIMILVSFFGCCGAIMENKTMLTFYFGILLLTFLAMLVSGILAFVFRSQLNEEMRGTMKSIIVNDYGVELDNSYNRAVTNGWDAAQEYLYCCSVEDQSWGSYLGSQWYKSQQDGLTSRTNNGPYVPISCCTRNQYGEYINPEKCQYESNGPPGQQSGQNNEALHYRGCFNAGKDFVKKYTNYLVGLGFGIALSILAGMCFSIYLILQVSRY